MHAIGNGVKALLEHKVDPARAFATDAACYATVEELLRLDAPLHLFNRYALEDVEFAGVKLKRGDKVGLLRGEPRPRAFPLSGRFSIRGASPTRMSPSGPASTLASARRWRGSSSRPSCRFSLRGCRARGSSSRRAIGTPSTSTGALCTTREPVILCGIARM